MKQTAKRMLAFVCAFAMVLALAAFNPTVAYASEADEPYEAPNSVSITITEETHFSFTPNATGYWTFVTSDNYYCAPRLWVINHYGHVLATDRGTAEGNNAIVKLHLVEGAPYVIRAGFDWSDMGGTYTLTLFMSDEFVRPVRPGAVFTVIPGEGGVSSGRERINYSFTPDTCGLWEIHIVGAGEALDFDIRDDLWNTIAFHHDMNPPEFHGTVRLVSGVEYRINGWSDWNAEYTLSIAYSDTFIPWVDWDEVALWFTPFDFEADRLPVPPYGGEFLIEEKTHLSFTPESSGIWDFIIAVDNNDNNAIIMITDAYGSILVAEQSWGWDVWLELDLIEGVEYVILVSCLVNDEFNLDLTIEKFTTRIFWDDDWNWDDDWGWDPDWDDFESWVVRIPSEGGYVHVGSNSSFLFSPDTMGSWSIQLAGLDHFDLTLSDISHSFWLSMWDSGVISMHMAPGFDYAIETWIGWDNNDAILIVSPTYVITPPRADAVMQRRVFMDETDFSFTPIETGYWLIYTSHNIGATDPYIWLLDAEGNIIAEDDDNGAGLNSLIKIHLEAGVEHTIRAGFFIGGGEYMLTVRMAGSAQTGLDLVVLEPPAL